MTRNSDGKRKDDKVLMAHGGGGELMRALLHERVFPRLENPILNRMMDSAVLPRQKGRICLTTDSYVVRPIRFPGGDIGRLAVCGTVNDLAVMGARPVALTLSLIIEEGFPMKTLDGVLDSIARTAGEAGVDIVTGDTKVIDRREGDGLLINTAGVGVLPDDVDIDPSRIVPGDVILINGGIAEHGLAVMSVREHLTFETELRSDAAPLHGLIRDILETGASIRFMRDPTRGGVAGVLADLVEETGHSLEIEEHAVPITPVALQTAEMLGLDPLSVANEGKVLVVCAADDAERALEAIKRHPLGRNGAGIGRFLETEPPLAELVTRGGGRRLIQRPYGEDLPRIC